MDAAPGFIGGLINWFGDLSPQTLIIIGVGLFALIFLVRWTVNYVKSSLESQPKEDRQIQRQRVAPPPKTRPAAKPVAGGGSVIGLPPLPTDDITTYTDITYGRKPLATPLCLGFWPVLHQAAPGCHIFPQVAIGNLITVNSTDSGRLSNVLRVISTYKADFVVCGPQLEILAVIDVGDGEPGVKIKKKNIILSQAGYKALYFDVRNMPTAEALKWEIFHDNPAAFSAERA